MILEIISTLREELVYLGVCQSISDHKCQIYIWQDWYKKRSIVIIELHWNGKESGGNFQYNCKMYLLVAVYVYDKMAFDLACRFKILTKLP